MKTFSPAQFEDGEGASSASSSSSSMAAAACLRALERVERIIEQETLALRSRQPVDLADLNRRKSYGLLELSRSMRGVDRATAVTWLAPSLRRLRGKLAPSGSAWIASLGLDDQLAAVGDEGYVLAVTSQAGLTCTVIAANTDVGVLYGAFHFLRLLQTRQAIHVLAISSKPRIKLRVLNHWDNLDRTIERGYAGFSLWDWHKLPDYLDPRYRDYARACASVGLNGTLLNNTNASAYLLMEQYLVKVAAMVDVFRPYGLKIFISVRFSAPIELGGAGHRRSCRSGRAGLVEGQNRRGLPARAGSGRLRGQGRIPKANPARMITTVPTPKGPTCWPTPWPIMAAC